MPDGLIVEYLFVSKNEYNAGVSQKIVDFSPAGAFQFPLTTDYKSLSDKVSVKNVVAEPLTKYYTYSKCKRFKNSENTTEYHAQSNRHTNCQETGFPTGIVPLIQNSSDSSKRPSG